MQFFESTGPRATRDGLGAGLLELGLEAVEEERIYDLVDVLGAREVLAVCAAVVVGQRPLEDGAEYRGAHARPIKLLAPLDDKRIAEALGQGRNLRLLAEEAAVHVRQLLQPGLGILVTIFVFGVEPNKQVLEASSEITRLEV